MQQDFPGGLVVKNRPSNAGDAGSIDGPGRPWRRKFQPTHCSYLGNSMDRGARWATNSPWVHKRVGHNLTNKQQIVQRLFEVVS